MKAHYLRRLAELTKSPTPAFNARQMAKKFGPVDDEIPLENASPVETYAATMRRVAKMNPTGMVTMDYPVKEANLDVRLQWTPTMGTVPASWQLRIQWKTGEPSAEREVELLEAFRVPPQANIPATRGWAPSEKRWEWSEEPIDEDVAKA